MSGVWVGLETNNGELRSVAFEMLTAARRLADASGAQVCALVWGEGAQDSAKALGECGADSVVVVELSSDASARPAEVSAALAQLAAEQNPSVLLLADGAFSRSVAPALAQKLSASFVADVIDVAFDGKPVFTRLPYSGKVIERVAPTDASAFTIASIRPKAFEAAQPEEGRTAGVSTFAASPVAAARVLQDVVRAVSERVDLSEADIVVSGGRGLKGPEGFKVLEELADVLGAAIGASRPAIDEGWIDAQYQVGQTGKTVAPSLYIACGISGSIQHMAGISASKYIVAINKDPEAEIFAQADYGIVADLFEAVPLLTQQMRDMLQA